MKTLVDLNREGTLASRLGFYKESVKYKCHTEIKNNTWALGDMEFTFECSNQF